MKKKILLPTDFSINAWTALKYASELYKNEEVDFYILHAFFVTNYSLSSMMVPEPGEKYYEEAKSKAELELKKLLQRIELLEVPSNQTFFTKAVFNSPVEAVKNFIEDRDIELVIIGTKGETDSVTTVLGSNTVDMMEKVRNCPVLVIPPNSTFKDPNEIVFPTSFKTHYKRKELNYLYEISRITNAPVRVIHVIKELSLSQEQKEKRELLKECFDGLDYTFHYIEHKDVVRGLEMFMTERGSEMIAFINKKHAFFGSIFSKPMVKDIGNNVKVPILTLHDLRN